MLELQPHPIRVKNPVTGKKDLIPEAFKLQRQLMLDGVRIAYVSLKEKIRISFIVYLEDSQKQEIEEWVSQQVGPVESVSMVPNPDYLPSEAFIDGVPMDVGVSSDADYDSVSDS